MSNENKKIELWEGYEVEFNAELADDFDFAQDLNKAIKNNDLAELTAMMFALVGGDEVYEAAREHIVAETGRFSTKALMEIIDKISAALPKAGNRAQKRSWQTSK